jgi:hypothetical protein
MSFGLVFWILMLIWFVFSIVINFGLTYVGHMGGAINDVLLFILFLLLGWKVFGQPIHQ